MTKVILDRFATLEYCCTGSLGSSVDFEMPDEFVVFSSEYGALYAMALRARRPRCGPLHDVAQLLDQQCECRSGWLPMLSTSFLRSVVPVPVHVLPSPPETVGLRLRLRSAMPELADLEASFLAGVAWEPAPIVGCSWRTTASFKSVLRTSAVPWHELVHACGAEAPASPDQG